MYDTFRDKFQDFSLPSCRWYGGGRDWKRPATWQLGELIYQR